MPPAIYNLASINLDKIIELERLPVAGETIAGQHSKASLGGKGTNISVAIQRAGQDVTQICAIHHEDTVLRQFLVDAGIGSECVEASQELSGEAIILLDQHAENSIIVIAGANRSISDSHIAKSLENANPGDWLVMQNETNGQAKAVQIAKQKGMKIAYVAAPFETDAIRKIKSNLDLLILNETEAEQLSQSVGDVTDGQTIPKVLVTLGAAGAVLYGKDLKLQIDGHKVTPRDTTAAGDTFCGFYIAGIASGHSEQLAIEQANAAAALAVQSLGASDSIPSLKDVQKFMTTK